MQTRAEPLLHVAILAILAGCSGPFVPDHSTEDAIRAFTSCVYGYASPRLDFNVTAEELAEAAIGACPSQLNEVRELLVRSSGQSVADRTAEDFMQETRRSLLTSIVDARNLKQPLQVPSAPAGN